MEGIAIFSTSHVLIDDVGVRQLGGLASELAKQIAEKAQEQQDAVLADAQQMNIDSLYQLPPLRRRPPDDDGDAPTAGPALTGLAAWPAALFRADLYLGCRGAPLCR